MYSSQVVEATGTGWDRLVLVELLVDSLVFIFRVKIITNFTLLQDVLSFLESRKENRAWYKGSRIAVSVSSNISFCL